MELARRRLPYSVAGLIGVLIKQPSLPAALPYWAVAAILGGLVGAEFTKINATATPDITLVSAHLKNSNIGLKNTPPPIPVNPDNIPKTAPRPTSTPGLAAD